MAVCLKCGKTIKEESTFCPYCGAAVEEATTKPLDNIESNKEVTGTVKNKSLKRQLS